MFSALFGSSASSSPESGGDAHVATMEVRAAYTLRRAWFERLASSEPSVLDFFVTQEHEACRAVAHAPPPEGPETR